VEASHRRLRRAEQSMEGHTGLLVHRRHTDGDSGLWGARVQLAADQEQLTRAQAALHSAQLATPVNPWPDAHGPQLERLDALDAQIRQLSTAWSGELAGAPPSYLVTEIGRPHGSDDHGWRRAASEIESYRARWGIEDHEHALPAPARAAEAHRETVRERLVDLGYSVGIDGIARQ
jgi:hypothetical protein